METVAEGLWALADSWEESGHVEEAIKCLEAICQSQVSFLPIIDVKTRLRVASLLLRCSDNIQHAKAHLERAQLLLKQLPACFELKCRAYSLLSRCYYLLGTIPNQKQVLKRALDLTKSAAKERTALLWTCNFNVQLANALTSEGDHETAIEVLEAGLQTAEEAYSPDLQLMFSISILHVYLMQWQDSWLIHKAIERCQKFWNILTTGSKSAEVLAIQVYRGLFVYKAILEAIYFLRSCDYTEASSRADLLDQLMSDQYDLALSKDQIQKQFMQEQLRQLEFQLGQPSLSDEDATCDLQARYQIVQHQLYEFTSRRQPSNCSRIESFGFGEVGTVSLGPPSLGEEWLPYGALNILVHLLKVLCMRPKGMFKDCHGRIDKGLSSITEELTKLGVTSSTSESNLEHWAIWLVGVYLMLWIQLLENKIVVDLTQTEFAAAQNALLRILDCYSRFPTMLQSFESNIHMLLGHYAQSMACFQDAAAHFVEASKLTDSKGMQAMSQINAALSFVCLEDFSQALDLIEPVYVNMDSYPGVREKTSVLFASGVLELKKGNMQEARARLATGLTLTHKQLCNHQLLSQYLTVLGGIAASASDTGQAHDILKSSLTLARALHDLPTQVGTLAELTGLWQILGQSAKELENSNHGARKSEELTTCIAGARASSNHSHLLKFGLA